MNCHHSSCLTIETKQGFLEREKKCFASNFMTCHAANAFWIPHSTSRGGPELPQGACPALSSGHWAQLHSPAEGWMKNVWKWVCFLSTLVDFTSTINWNPRSLENIAVSMVKLSLWNRWEHVLRIPAYFATAKTLIYSILSSGVQPGIGLWWVL